MNAERHIFGNVRGYATLARSADVDEAVCQQLESVAFSFGQTNDARYAQTLEQQPAFVIRELPGNRRCLTRVLQGGADDNGRPTLILISAILSRDDWDRRLFGNVQFLLDRRDLWIWDGGKELATLQLAGPPPARVRPDAAAKLLTLIGQIERGWADGCHTVVSISDYGPAELAALEMLVPPSVRSVISIACNSLNGQFPATVNAPAAAASSRVTFHNGRPSGEVPPYTRSLAQAGVLSGAIPLETIMSYRRFGQSSDFAAAEIRSAAAASPGVRLLPAMTVMVILCLCTSFASYALAHSQAQDAIRDLQAKLDQLKRDVESRHSRVTSEIDGLNEAIGQANVRSGRIATDGADVRAKMQRGFENQIAKLAQQLDGLEGRTRAIQSDIKRLQAPAVTGTATQPARGSKP